MSSTPGLDPIEALQSKIEQQAEHIRRLEAENRRLESELRPCADSETRFRRLADAMPQLVWTAGPDGTVDYYNARYREYAGIAPTEAGEWQWAPVLHPEDVQATVEVWEHAVATGQTYQIEHRVRMADGPFRWHLSRGIASRDASGRVVKWFGTATDIHDQKLAESELQSYAERLRRSNAELEAFAYVASHDLQEPLRKLEAFSQSLQRSIASPSEQQLDTLQRIQSAADRMRRMIEALLSLARVTTDTHPFLPVDLNEAVGGAISDLELRVRQSGGRVEVGELGHVTADPVQMRQLFLNLIGNALKYRRPEVPPQVRVTASQVEAGWLAIAVADNGIGFDPAQAEAIFQPFKRLVGRNEYEGSGMGLAICRKIVERHGGTISAESQVGCGATFTVLLPVEPV